MGLGKSVLHLVLLGVALGVVVGVAAYRAGVGNACPTNQCVSQAKVKPVFDRGYFEEALGIISNAKRSIHVVSFEVKYYRSFPSSLQNRLVRELIYAKDRGVDVKIVVDEYSKENNAYSILRENGVDVRYDGEGATTHAKLIIVDGEIVLLGSTNLSYYGLEKNGEANVLIEDEKTAQNFEKYFRSIWASG